MPNQNHSIFQTILNSLWILMSFVPILNGLGFIYIGSKTFNDQLIKEGVIYEVPWMALFIVSGISSSNALVMGFLGLIALIAIASMIISLIRSVSIIPAYENILSEGRYRKSRNKIKSVIGVIITCIPFLNGLPFIYLGSKYSNDNLRKQGILYEAIWIISLIAIFVTNFIVGIAVVVQIISINNFIKLNYSSDKLSYGYNSPVSHYTAPEVQYREVEKDEKEEEPVTTVYEPYKHTIYDLTEKYDSKEEAVCELIDKRFSSSELTHERFMRIINNSHENFYTQRESALNIINLSDIDSILEDKINEKIRFLELIIEKIANLQRELIVNDIEDKQSNDNIKVLMEDMEELIDSVKDYK